MYYFLTYCLAGTMIALLTLDSPSGINVRKQFGFWFSFFCLAVPWLPVAVFTIMVYLYDCYRHYVVRK